MTRVPRPHTGGSVAALALALTCALGLAPCDAWPATAVDQALAMQAAGQHAEAVAALQSARQALDPKTSPGAWILVGYTLGQLYVDQAGRMPGDQAALLDRAAVEYRKILEVDAADAATTSALAGVLDRQGRAADADSLLDRWIRNTPGPGAAVLALQLGDLRRDRKLRSPALAAYRTARKYAPESETPWRRLTEIMAADPKSLWAWTDSLRQQYPKLAELGYRTFISRYPSDTVHVESAFVRWVGLAADQGRPGDPLPPEANVLKQPRLQLAGFTENPVGAPPWWRQSFERRDALARVCLSLGRIAAASKPAWAERCWNAGVSFAPDYDELTYGAPQNPRPEFARLEMLTELAALYDREGTLDPKGQRLGAIINDMFNSKAAAYERGDLDAIQRHHTVLGMIYARRGVWTSTGRAQNAIFQLQHALTVARQREATVGPQPLPELKSTLADGYQAVGDGDHAMTTRLLAAQGFLDTDHAREAESELDKLAKAFPAAPAPVRDANEALRQVATTRLRLAELLRADSTRARTGLLEVESAPPEWLVKGKAAGLPDDFVARQRFKAYSDLSALSATGGARDRAARYAVQAVDEIKKSPPVGPADVVRIRRIQRQTQIDLVREVPSMHHLPMDRDVEVKPFDARAPGSIKTLEMRPELPAEVRLNATILDDKVLAAVKPTVRVAGDSVVVSIRDTTAADPKLKEYVRKKLGGLVDGRRIAVVNRPGGP